MPLSAHYHGSGEKVASSMKKTYGKDWERVFYATENARKQKPENPSLKQHMKAGMKRGRHPGMAA